MKIKAISRRLWVSLRRDNIINYRNGYYLVTLLVALLYITMVRWLIPADTSLKPTVFIVDRTAGAKFAGRAVASEGEEKLVLLANEGELVQHMEANQNSIGMLLVAGDPLPEATFFFQPHHNQRVRNLLLASYEAEVRDLYGAGDSSSPAHMVETQVLRPDTQETKPTFRQTWVPILLFTDTAMLGLIFIAALIFMEKDEGTVKAYLVSPGRIWEYLLSKALTLALLAVLFSLVFVPLTLGTGPNYLYLVLMMAAGSLFGSLLGAWLAVYFDTISQAFFPLVGTMVLLTVPSMAYFMPSFSPLWLRLIPTYPLVFGLREALFPAGNPQIIYQALGLLLVFDLFLLAASSLAFYRQYRTW